MGTDEYLKYLQSETPGELETSYTEDVDKYIKEAKKANDEKKKQHFGMSFDNPLKGYPYNEQFGFDKNLMEIEEGLADIELEEGDSDKALKNKAEKSGMPLGILKKVFTKLWELRVLILKKISLLYHWILILQSVNPGM